MSSLTLLVASAVTLVAFLAGGVVAAALWDWFADPPYSVVSGDNAFQGSEQLGRRFGIDAAFAWASLTVAVPLGALVGVRWHRVGWPLAFTLTVAGAIASVIAWRLGVVLGPAAPRELLVAAQDGDRLYEPLELHAVGLLLTAPVGALIGFMVAVAAVGDRGPQQL